MPLDYPSDFNTPAFPAGKSVALSRLMGIASCVTFLLVIFLCGILIWAVRSQRIDPFIVEIDKLTGQWTVVGHSHGNGPIEYSAKMALQESVLGNFTANWFSVSGAVRIHLLLLLPVLSALKYFFQLHLTPLLWWHLFRYFTVLFQI